VIGSRQILKNWKTEPIKSKSIDRKTGQKLKKQTHKEEEEEEK
jgi:hypothetical protein